MAVTYLTVSGGRVTYSRALMDDEDLNELIARDDWGMAVFLEDYGTEEE